MTQREERLLDIATDILASAGHSSTLYAADLEELKEVLACYQGDRMGDDEASRVLMPDWTPEPDDWPGSIPCGGYLE